MGRTSRHTRRRRAIGALILAGGLVLSACSAGGDDSAADDSADMEAAASEPAAEEPAEAPTEGGFAASDDDAGDTGDGTTIDLGQVGRDVIIEMRVTVSSDDLQRSVSAVSARAAALGGGVASSEVDFGNPVLDEDGGYAVLVVKVPPAAIDDLIAGIEQTGTIQSINQSAQDVTEQLIDLDVRIDNARESVENVREFMERAEDLNDLVTLESELTRRQTELERLEAQQRNLSERVAFSTVTVEIIPTAAVPDLPDEDDDTIADAFRQGWNGFTSMIFGIGYVLAVLAPFLAAAAVVGLIVWLVVARRRRAGETDQPAPEPEP